MDLKLADYKENILLRSSRMRMEFITITAVDQRITSKQAIKYLQVIIDNSLQHAATSCALARIMPNLGDPRQERRRLLMKLVTSIVIYAASVWAGAMDKKIYRTPIYAAKRSALRIISVFNAVSTYAAVVVAGMMPLKLEVDIERRKHNTIRGKDLSYPINSG